MAGPLAGALAAAFVAGTAGAEPSPHAGLERRDIKALSEEDLADLLAGRGTGMALAAELNHYPGPVHVLELAATLELTPEQEAKTRRLFERMQAEAVPLGEAVVAREAQLDRMFASKAADEDAVRVLVAGIARLRGELRFVHLKCHLAMQRLLSPQQLAAYDAARGYATGAAHDHGAREHRGEGAHHP